MAQTKRKRRSKHRGNAAGVVESRGRTGRQVAPAKGSKSAIRANRLDNPPTWRAAANRSAIATVLFIAVITLLQRNFVVALAIGIFMFFFYTAMGYYTDDFMYKRRQAKKAAGKL
jgi:glycerol uptake facilitator-like aquaporin